MLIDLYNGFYENCLYNGFYVDCFLYNFYYYEKGCFEIRKYAFLIFQKGHKQKIVPGFLGFVSKLF